MAGFGKTVLAAEAVRDAKILEEVFPGKERMFVNESCDSGAIVILTLARGKFVSTNT